MNRKITIYAALVLFIAIFTSCESDNNPYVRVADRATFEQQRVLWEESWSNHSRNLSGESWDYVHYQFTYSYFSGSSGPVGPVTVTVREGEESIVENNPEDHRPLHLIFESMEDVFDFLNRTFEDIENIKTNFRDVYKIIFEIEYCNQHHFPKRVLFSAVLNQPMPGAPHYTLEVTDFKRLD